MHNKKTVFIVITFSADVCFACLTNAHLYLSLSRYVKKTRYPIPFVWHVRFSFYAVLLVLVNIPTYIFRQASISTAETTQHLRNPDAIPGLRAISHASKCRACPRLSRAICMQFSSALPDDCGSGQALISARQAPFGHFSRLHGCQPRVILLKDRRFHIFQESILCTG